VNSSNEHRIGNVPNLVSLTRLPLAALFPFTLEHPVWAIALLVAAGATDVFDGWYARRFHQETPTGAWLDAVMDKAFVLTVVVTLIAASLVSPDEALLLATRDLGELPLLLYWLAVRRARRRERSANQLGKLATLAQFAAVAALIAGAPHRGAWIAGTAACGAVAAISYFLREWRAERKAQD